MPVTKKKTEKKVRPKMVVTKPPHKGPGLFLATSVEEIRWVYINGPSSCMSGSSPYKLRYGFPSDFYGYCKNTGVAFILSKTGSVVARTVVTQNTKTKKWFSTRLYLNCDDRNAISETVFQEVLRKNGYDVGAYRTDRAPKFSLPVSIKAVDATYRFCPTPSFDVRHAPQYLHYVQKTGMFVFTDKRNLPGSVYKKPGDFEPEGVCITYRPARWVPDNEDYDYY